MANSKKKISELTALNSASLQTTLVGVDNGTTYKITLDVLEDAIINMVSRSTDLRLDALETYTASANAASDISSLNSFTSSQTTLNTAYTNGINGRLQTSSFNSFSASVHSEIIAATNEQSFNGLISGSSQLTGSYDSRYVLSGSITQTTWDNISGKPSGLVSQSTDLSSLNSFTASYFTNSSSFDSRLINLNSYTSSNDAWKDGVTNDVSAINVVISSLNNTYATDATLNAYTSSNDAWKDGVTNDISAINGVISSLNNTYATDVEVAAGYEAKGRDIVSGSSQLTSSFDIRYALSASYLTSLNGTISSSIQILGGSGIYSSSAQLPLGLISGSSQLTASFDTRYTLSGSVQPLPSGLISGSSQLTSSFDTIYLTIGGDNVISGSSQLTASLDTRYAASGSGGSLPSGVISGSSQLTSSLDLRYLVTGSVTSSILQLNTFTASNANISLNTFTSSLNIWTSSVATTGSNSFNGNQTITGSLNVSSVAIISSSFTANSSSLTLNSGSNFYLQNNGIAEISGSLLVSGSTTFTGSISISSGSITMPNRPGFRVYGLGGATTATTILSGSMTIVDYNQGGWDNTTGIFTAPIAGLYQVNLVCRTNSNSSAQSVQVIVYKNNTTISPSPNGTAQVMVEWAANTTTNHIGASTISKLAVGDTLKAIVTVGTASFDVNDNFSVAYIG